jgi:hypothetical protein
MLVNDALNSHLTLGYTYWTIYTTSQSWSHRYHNWRWHDIHRLRQPRVNWWPRSSRSDRSSPHAAHPGKREIISPFFNGGDDRVPPSNKKRGNAQQSFARARHHRGKVSSSRTSRQGSGHRRCAATYRPRGRYAASPPSGSGVQARAGSMMTTWSGANSRVSSLLDIKKKSIYIRWDFY